MKIILVALILFWVGCDSEEARKHAENLFPAQGDTIFLSQWPDSNLIASLRPEPRVEKKMGEEPWHTDTRLQVQLGGSAVRLSAAKDLGKTQSQLPAKPYVQGKEGATTGVKIEISLEALIASWEQNQWAESVQVLAPGNKSFAQLVQDYFISVRSQIPDALMRFALAAPNDVDDIHQILPMGRVIQLPKLPE
jgi:hypothetical protein